MLAETVYCMQVITLKKLLPTSQRETQTIDSRNHFLSMRQKHLADSTFSPISKALNLLAIGKHIRLNTGNSGNAY
jgi:superfamily II DNA helicase RecQ